MKNINLIRIVESFVVLPLATIPISFANIPQTGASLVSVVQSVSENKETLKNVLSLPSTEEKQETKEELELKAKKAEAIDAYFKDRGMPLAGMGMKMVLEAEKNGLDWRLIAAISVRESTGGKFECIKATYNAFGWGSCKINFKSNEHAIETVARNLGGNNPNTAYHYKGKGVKAILQAYNPPSIVPKYAEQVMSIMDTIGEADLVTSEVAQINK